MRSKGPQAGEEILPEAGMWILLGSLVFNHSQMKSCHIHEFTVHMSYLFNLWIHVSVISLIDVDCACMRFVYLLLG